MPEDIVAEAFSNIEPAYCATRGPRPTTAHIGKPPSPPSFRSSFRDQHHYCEGSTYGIHTYAAPRSLAIERGDTVGSAVDVHGLELAAYKGSSSYSHPYHTRPIFAVPKHGNKFPFLPRRRSPRRFSEVPASRSALCEQAPRRAFNVPTHAAHG